MVAPALPSVWLPLIQFLVGAAAVAVYEWLRPNAEVIWPAATLIVSLYAVVVSCWLLCALYFQGSERG